MGKKPLINIPLYDKIRNLLIKNLDLYSTAILESPSLYKHEVCYSPDSKYIMTGSYNNRFLVYEADTGRLNSEIEASRIHPLKKKIKGTGKGSEKETVNNTNICEPLTVENLDFDKKLVKVSWHPQKNILSLAACSNLYIYAI